VVKSTDMAAIEEARLEKYRACVAAREQAEAARIAALDGLTNEQTMLVLTTDAMVRQAEALGGKADPCSQGMGAFEMEVSIARSRNEVIGTLGATALRVGGAVGGAVVAADAIKSVAKTAGDKITATEGSSVTVEKTTAITETNVKTGDEAGGDVSVTGPTTSGTDKSTHETVHEAATPAAEETPEEPEGEAETAEPEAETTEAAE
jgi:hypothetical protein